MFIEEESKMQVIENEMIVAFDVDDTLVMWNSDFREDSDVVQIPFYDPNDGSTNYLRPHLKHIDLIKKYAGRGMTVIVWSAAGYAWARSVVQTLELEPFVDFIMTKPSKLVDDLTPNEIFTTRIYLKDK